MSPKLRTSRQFNLFSGRERSRPTRASADRYLNANRRAAQIILQSPQRYDGLPVVWARLVLAGGARPEGPR
jgi:hypothetical protein